MKYRVLFTEYEKYFAENIAAIIINSGGHVLLSEVITNKGFLMDYDPSYKTILVFPSNYLTFEVSHRMQFLEDLVRIGDLRDIICLDYSYVNDLSNNLKCQDVLGFLEHKFKKIVRVKSQICLDEIFHKKVGVTQNSNHSYVLLNKVGFIDETKKTNLLFDSPDHIFYLDSSFSYFDFIFAVELVDFCVVNYEIDSNSLFCQICNYLNKPLYISDLSYSNLSHINIEFKDSLMDNKQLTDEDLTKLMHMDLIDRDRLKSNFLSLIN